MSAQELPKVPVEIKDELANFTPDKLKACVTQEKIVLPSKEGEWTTLSVEDPPSHRHGHRYFALLPCPNLRFTTSL